MNEAQLHAADMMARRHFTYREDSGGDNWRSHATEARLGQPWTGDCDDLASTVLDLLTRDGAPLDRCYRLLVNGSGRGKKVDHMVAAVQTDAGRFWIVGDTFSPSYVASAMRHRGLYFNRLSEAGSAPVWREGTPWEAAKVS